MNMNRNALLSVPFLLFVACNSVSAGTSQHDPQQPVAAPVSQAPANGKRRLEAGEHSVRSLVDIAAQLTGRNWIVHPGELEGAPAILLQNAVEIADKNAEAFVAELLWLRGFVVVSREAAGDAREVISLQGPRRSAVFAEAPVRTLEEVMAKPGARLPIRVSMHLAHINGTVANNSLRPFFASAGASPTSLTFGSAGNHSMLVICGIQSEVAQAISLIRSVDVADESQTKQQVDLQQEVETLRARVQQLEQQLAAKKG